MRQVLFVLSVFGVLCATSCKHRESLALPVVSQDKCLSVIPSFSKDVQPILASTCAINGCHNGTDMPYNYGIYAQLSPVLLNKQFYYKVIRDGSMPQGSPLDSLDLLKLTCWYQQGFPDN